MGNMRSRQSAEGARPTRAVALVGPAGTGKTSLAEALLHASGTIPRLGSIAAGTCTGDASAEARARHGSTEINLMHFEWQGDRYALIDVPGGAGFAADGNAALLSADMAIVVIDPVPERACLAEPALRLLDEAGVPHAIFINKIETAQTGAVRDLIAELQPLSREPLALRQIPIREGERVTGYVDLALERAYRYRPGAQSERMDIPAEIAAREQAERAHLLETLADFDDALLEALLNDQPADTATVMADLATDTAGNKLVPVVMGSALTEGGVHRLLKLLRHETPPLACATRRMGVEGSALHVFKIAHGGAMGRLALGRVLAGEDGIGIGEGDDLTADAASVRAGAMFLMQGERTTKIADARPGDVVAVARLDVAQPGMVLPAHGGRCAVPPMPSRPARNAAIAIATRDRKDDVKLSAALHRLCEEDPTLEWSQDDAAHETLLRGVNDDHLATALARLQRRHGIALATRPPRIAYRESIRKNGSQRGRHRKQSGGHGQYGDCVIEIRPLPHGEGFRFDDRITGGAIPRQYIPAVEQGVRDACEKGPLGFPVVDVAVALTDGSFHAVDSSDLAFRIAGRTAMAEALAQASPYLLEPVCRVTIDTPAGTGSKAGSTVSARRGQILGLAPHPERPRWERVEALLPEAGLHGLDAELRSLSQGLAEFSAAFDHLAELSGRHADDVVKARLAEAA